MIEIGSHLLVICDELKRLSQEETLPDRAALYGILENLGAVDKFVVSKYFCRLPWNIGSIRLLAALQKKRILTATEYILSIDIAEQIQLVLNDLLEAEFELISNVFLASYDDSMQSTTINALLDDCLGRLFADLLINPELNNLCYLKIVKAQLPATTHLKLAQKHINAMLELHSSHVKYAFKNYSAWINSGVDDIKFTKDLYKELITLCDKECLNYLFKISAAEHFKEWKFYLILLQTIACRCSAETTTYIKNYLKTRIRQIAASPKTNAMAHLLLTARAACAATEDINKNFDAYANWYKQNISDMKFVLSVEEFKAFLALMDECVNYEMELDYLEIHAAISISPPVLCGRLVQSYKSKCKLRLSQLKNTKEKIDPNQSIAIDDSD